VTSLRLNSTPSICASSQALARFASPAWPRRIWFPLQDMQGSRSNEQSASLVSSGEGYLGAKFMAEVRHVIAGQTRGCRRSGFPNHPTSDSKLQTTGEQPLDQRSSKPTRNGQSSEPYCLGKIHDPGQTGVTAPCSWRPSFGSCARRRNAGKLPASSANGTPYSGGPRWVKADCFSII